MINYLIGAVCGASIALILVYLAFIYFAIYFVTGDENWLGIPFFKKDKDNE